MQGYKEKVKQIKSSKTSHLVQEIVKQNQLPNQIKLQMKMKIQNLVNLQEVLNVKLNISPYYGNQIINILLIIKSIVKFPVAKQLAYCAVAVLLRLVYQIITIPQI